MGRIRIATIVGVLALVGVADASEHRLAGARVVLAGGGELVGTVVSRADDGWCLATERGERLVPFSDMAAASEWAIPVGERGEQWAALRQADGTVVAGLVLGRAPWRLAGIGTEVLLAEDRVEGAVVGPAAPGPQPGGLCSAYGHPAIAVAATGGLVAPTDAGPRLELRLAPGDRCDGEIDGTSFGAAPGELVARLEEGDVRAWKALRHHGRGGAEAVAAWLRSESSGREVERAKASLWLLRCGPSDTAQAAAWLLTEPLDEPDFLIDALQELTHRMLVFTERQVDALVRSGGDRALVAAALVGYSATHKMSFIGFIPVGGSKDVHNEGGHLAPPPHHVEGLRQLVRRADRSGAGRDLRKRVAGYVGAAFLSPDAGAWCGAVQDWIAETPRDSGIVVRLVAGASRGLPPCAGKLLDDTLADYNAEAVDEWLDGLGEVGCSERSRPLLEALAAGGATPTSRGRANRVLQRCR